MTNKKFSGLHTALVTPFKENGEVDYDSFENLIDFQIEANVDGLVLLGTTGESPTIEKREREKVISMAVEKVKGALKIIVGTGTNYTKSTVERTKEAKDLGADAALVVNPYYNKPNQVGLYRHFMTVADSVDAPIMLYNIKGRTAVNIETSTLIKLSKHENIIGVKEASGDLIQVMDVISSVDKDFVVLSGDDVLTLPMMSLGAHGVVSVISNLLPREMKNIVLQCFTNLESAKSSHFKLYDFMKLLLSLDTNPVPIKTILAKRGMIKEVFRLPMSPMGDEKEEMLFKAYNNISIS